MGHTHFGGKEKQGNAFKLPTASYFKGSKKSLVEGSTSIEPTPRTSPMVTRQLAQETARRALLVCEELALNFLD